MMRPVASPSRQRGAALVIAMVIVAIAVILTTQLMWQSHLDLRRVENQLYGGQAIAYAIGAEDWAKEILLRDDASVDHLGEDWASQDARFPIEGGTLVGSLVDLQGSYNLNNLYNEAQSGTPQQVRQEQLEALGDLLASFGIDPGVANAAYDWQDSDIEPQGTGGAEDSAYSRQQPPYLAPNRAMLSRSELRAVAGITAEQYLAVRDYVTALPVDASRININTAPAEVISAFTAEPLDDASIAAILSYRDQRPIQNLDELTSVVQGPNVQSAFPPDRFGVNSSWFLLTVRAQIGSSSVTMYSVLHRDAARDTVQTVSRSFGTY